MHKIFVLLGTRNLVGKLGGKWWGVSSRESAPKEIHGVTTKVQRS